MLCSVCSFVDLSCLSYYTYRDGIPGIRPNGASYLLVPDIRYYNLRLSRPRVRSSPWPGDCFISLSPIHFPSMAALDEKKKSYDSNKKDKRGPRDRSKANTTFTSLGDGLSKEGIERASFEHQRCVPCVYVWSKNLMTNAQYLISLVPRRNI